jgi:8-oxo-dGTP pyrophosphatase MutT (NUDIX family)
MNKSNNNNNLCNNCGKHGHLFHHCKLPITSYGIVLFRSSADGLQLLMIRRKDSYGYIDFIRGKYTNQNVVQIQKMIDQMSNEEKERIQQHDFNLLWKMMWGDNNYVQYRSEESSSSKKFDSLKLGTGTTYTLEHFIKESTTNWTETEWEFPKGRRNFQEKDLECALREFEEETGIQGNSISVVENVLPFEEIYIGSNLKSYKHKYYLAHMNDSSDILSNFQKTEVSKLEWKTVKDCISSIRPYNLEKIRMVKNITAVLQEYQLCS